MKINNVSILNWKADGKPPGTEYWNFVADHPDGPLIEARIDMILSHNEYHDLLRRAREAEKPTSVPKPNDSTTVNP